MAAPSTHLAPRRRDQQREQTRLDLALAAFELAKAHGLANVRVPQIAEAARVSPRTFNNYFPSKEAAIVWPAARRACRLAGNLADRPAKEPLAEALVEAVTAMYGRRQLDGLPAGWLRQFRTLVAAEPALHAEMLKSGDAIETALAEAIASRIGSREDQLEPRIYAAVLIGAERAAIRYWLGQAEPKMALVDVVRMGVEMALKGVEGVS